MYLAFVNNALHQKTLVRCLRLALFRDLIFMPERTGK
jgi:hypothetical protein